MEYKIIINGKECARAINKSMACTIARELSKDYETIEVYKGDNLIIKHHSSLKGVTWEEFKEWCKNNGLNECHKSSIDKFKLCKLG